MAYASQALSDFWLSLLGITVCSVLAFTVSSMVKLLLALVRLHTASINDIKEFADLKASKAASLQAVTADLAELKATTAASLQAVAADLAELKAATTAASLQAAAVVQHLAGEQVCQLARVIQNNIEMQRFSVRRPYFSTVLAEHRGNFAEFLEIAGLEPGFDVGGAALYLHVTGGTLPFYRDEAAIATHLCNTGYVDLARADYPWPCALVEHFGWVKNNLYDMER